MLYAEYRRSRRVGRACPGGRVPPSAAHGRQRKAAGLPVRGVHDQPGAKGPRAAPVDHQAALSGDCPDLSGLPVLRGAERSDADPLLLGAGGPRVSGAGGGRAAAGPAHKQRVHRHGGGISQRTVKKQPGADSLLPAVPRLQTGGRAPHGRGNRPGGTLRRGFAAIIYPMPRERKREGRLFTEGEQGRKLPAFPRERRMRTAGERRPQ